MKKLTPLILFSLSCTTQLTTQPDFELTQTNEHLYWGIPGIDGQLITREGYVLLHDGNKKVPLWVSYYLKPKPTLDTSHLKLIL